jgi:hypothetical protein
MSSAIKIAYLNCNTRAASDHIRCDGQRVVGRVSSMLRKNVILTFGGATTCRVDWGIFSSATVAFHCVSRLRIELVLSSTRAVAFTCQRLSLAEDIIMRFGFGLMLLAAAQALSLSVATAAETAVQSRQSQPRSVVSTPRPPVVTSRRVYSLTPGSAMITTGTVRPHRWSGLYPHEIIDARTGKVVGVTHEYQFGYDRIGSNW